MGHNGKAPMERIFTPVVAQRRSPSTAISGRKPGQFSSKLRRRSAFVACLFIFSFGSSPAFAELPTADDQSVSGDEDTDLLITLTGQDLDGDTLTFTVANDPTDGSVSCTAEACTYTPDQDFNGGDSFTFTVNDGTDDSLADGTVSITVDAVNDLPTANDQSVSGDEDTDLPITLSGGDVDGDGLTYTIANDPSNGSVSCTGASCTYTPDLDFSGADSFTFTVNDGTDDSLADGTVSITIDAVNDPPTAIDQTLSTDEDTDLPITLTGSDPEGDPLTFTVETDPGNGTLSCAADDCTYTPDQDFNGADSFTFTAKHGGDTSAAATVSITVDAVNDAPTANDQTLSTDEDTDLPITLSGGDVDGDGLTFAVAAQPDDGSVTCTAADCTYTPDPDFNGADSFTFTVNDGTVDSAEATISITVDSSNDLPTADDQTLSTAEDTDLAITLTGDDPDGDALTFAVATDPSDGTVTCTAEDCTYTPDLDFNGDDSFTFTVNDGTADSAEATISITVDSGNDLPTADDQTLSTNEDTDLSITLTGDDPDGDALTFTVASDPSDGTVTCTAEDCTYTPDLDFNGDDSFTFTVNDGTSDSGAATISITVDAVNDDPTADAQTLSTAEDTDLSITLTGDDPDGDALTFAVATDPDNGTVTCTAEACTYTPDQDFNGDDSFTFTVNDGTVDSAEATISITVDSGNDLPTADDQTLSTAEDTDLLITLTGDDPDGDALTFTVVTEPINGTLTCTEADCTYTPNLDFTGDDSFTFTVNDGTSDSAEATVSITVDAVNDAPTADAQTVIVDEDSIDTPITLTGTDPDGDVLTFVVVTQPLNGALVCTEADCTYTPTLDFNGADSFTFTVNDGTVDSVAATISITVNAINDQPILETPVEDQLAIEGTPFSLDISGNFTDGDGDALTFTASGLPANLSFDGATGVFSGTPLEEDARDNAPYIITVTATDGDPDTIPAVDEFDLNISALDRANVSLEIEVAPDPAMLNDELNWTFTASNSLGPQAATNVVLTGTVVGSGLNITSTGTCTIQAAVGLESLFDCTLGDLPVGGSSTVVLTTGTSSSGDVVVFATAETTDALPIDPVLDDNSSQLAVGVAEAFSNGAVQVLGNASVRSVAAGDVDGDGVADLVVGTAAGQPLQVYLSGGFRDFLTSPIGLDETSSNDGVALADFDGNGTLDLAVANGGGQADTIYSNDGTGNFTLLATLPGLTVSRDVAVGDFNNDGLMDVVFAALGGNPVFLGDGIGGFVADSTLGVADSYAVAVADFDGDGLDDIVFANVGSDSQLWTSNAAGGFVAGALLAIGDAMSVTVAEFDGIAGPDLAFGRIPSAPGDVPANPVLINDGNGVFGSPVALLGSSPTSDILAGDVNEDGLIDLVFINSSGVHQIWTANGGSFDLHREQIVDGDSMAGVLTDLGMTDVGDAGGVDLAMGGASVAGLGVFLNDGFGNLGKGDAVIPVLTLIGETTLDIASGSVYADAGASAEDNIDGNINSRIVVNNPVNTSVVGAYTVTYNVSDVAGNPAVQITRSVTVQPAVGTGGGGGGGVNPFFVLFLMLSTLFATLVKAKRAKHAIIPVGDQK